MGFSEDVRLLTPSRAGTDAIRAEAAPDDLDRRGIADMDFAAPAAVADALRLRVTHPVFGYTGVSAAATERLITWLARRHGPGDVSEDRLLQISVGPRTALEVAICATFGSSDIVVVPVPTYRGLLTALDNSGARIVAWALDPQTKDVRLGLDDLRRIAGEEGPTGFAWCSPNNPLGRAFAPQEVDAVLEAVGRSAALRTVIADEVHADLVHPGHVHGSTLTAARRRGLGCVVVGSMGKTLNVSGLATAHCLADTAARAQSVECAFARLGIRPGGIVSNVVHGALVNDVETWRIALIRQLACNVRTLAAGLAGTGFDLVPCTASFLATLRFDRLHCDEASLAAALAAEGVGVQLGTRFAAPAGQSLARVNFGLGNKALAALVDRLRRVSDRLNYRVG